MYLSDSNRVYSLNSNFDWSYKVSTRLNIIMVFRNYTENKFSSSCKIELPKLGQKFFLVGAPRSP